MIALGKEWCNQFIYFMLINEFNTVQLILTVDATLIGDANFEVYQKKNTHKPLQIHDDRKFGAKGTSKLHFRAREHHLSHLMCFVSCIVNELRSCTAFKPLISDLLQTTKPRCAHTFLFCNKTK